jgi:hypothetical protein
MIRRIKWVFQRLFRGWDDRTLWDLDYHIAVFVLPRLKEFKKIPRSYPAMFHSSKEWDDVLNKMLFAFEHIVDDSYFLEKETSEIKEIEEKIQAGLELFGKYFRGLWT